MTPEDLEYVREVLAAGYVAGPCLEVGSATHGEQLRALLRGAGVESVGTDIAPGPLVEVECDLEDAAQVGERFAGRRFRTALVLNVLEHVFDPVGLLDNVIGLLEPGGRAVLVTPAVWPLHAYPRDYWRLNPDFYEEYARRRGLRLVRSLFRYVPDRPVDGEGGAGGRAYPRPGRDRLDRFASRVVHRLFRTAGRGMHFPSHVAIGAVLERAESGPRS